MALTNNPEVLGSNPPLSVYQLVLFLGSTKFNSPGTLVNKNLILSTELITLYVN